MARSPTTICSRLTVTNVNQPPAFSTNFGDRTDAEGAVISFDADATDPDGDTLTYGATGLPGGITINTATGARQRHPQLHQLGQPTTPSLTVSRRQPDRHRHLQLDGHQHQPATRLQHQLRRPHRRRGRPHQLRRRRHRSGRRHADLQRHRPARRHHHQQRHRRRQRHPQRHQLGQPQHRHSPSRDGSLTDTDTFSWTVTNVNQPPVFSTNFGDRTDAEGAVISFDADATDPDGTR